MILDSFSKNGEKYYRAGMIDRLALTLENYASSEWGNRFYQEEFLKGFCEQRNLIHAQFGKATTSLVFFTTLLAFFDSIKGTTTWAGITFSIPELGSLALCVLVSIGFITFVSALLNQLIIDKFLFTLGARIGAYNFELVLLNFSAQNLWVSAITPKYFGLKSGTGHNSIQTIMGIFWFLLSIAFFSYPISVVVLTLSSALSNDPTLIVYAMTIISAICLISGLFILVSFCFKYSFSVAESGEPQVPTMPENMFDLGHPYCPPADSDEDENTSENNGPPKTSNA